MSDSRTLLATAALALGSAACVQVRFEKSTMLRPIERARTDALAPGTGLAECLARLGAPYFVWEQPEGALAVAYAWRRSSGWGVGVSVPIRSVDASFDFDALGDNTQGAVLWFDAHWKLERIERGVLRNLAAEPARPRPNVLGLGSGAALPFESQEPVQ